MKDDGEGDDKDLLSSSLLSFLDSQVQTNHPSVAPLAIHILLLTSPADSNYHFAFHSISRFIPTSSESL